MRLDLGALALCVLAMLAPGCALFRGKQPEPGLQLAFTGNKTFGRGDLVDVIAQDIEGFAKSTWKKSLIDDAAYDIERYYYSKGFASASVSYTYDEPEAGTPRAAFTIEEGPRTELAAVAFTGNTAIRTKDLEPLFEDPSPFFLAPKHTWYVESHVKSGIDDVIRLYYDRGYLDATVSPPAVTFSPDHKTARVAIAIQEGILHRLQDVQLTGELIFPLDELRKAFAPLLAKPYVERNSAEIEGKIEEFYADRGYVDVAVKRTERKIVAGGGVVLAFEVTPGPQIKVGDIHVSGNDETRESFIRARIKLEKGELYSRAKERESFRGLYKSGIFQRVDIAMKPDGPDQRDVDVTVKEAPALEVFFEPGYGSYERLRLVAGAREKNLFGTGRTIEAQGTLGAYDVNGRLTLIDPWFFGSDLVGNWSFFGGKREEPSFTKEQLGGALEVKYDLTHDVQLATIYQFKHSASSDVTIVTPTPSNEIENGNISSITLRAVHDTRNVIVAPTEGNLGKASCEVSSNLLGATIAFVRLEGTEAQFFPLAKTTSLAASFRTGWMVPSDGTQTIPIQERFFNGGENTVRSFQEDQLGPKDVNGAPIGGEAFTVFSTELRQMLTSRFQVAIFGDAGNVTVQHQDYFQFDGMRYAVGIGLRYILPIGPIRADSAFNPDPHPGEANFVFHFSVGMAF
jgi:outer membrane protein assembly complex protein YaeT